MTGSRRQRGVDSASCCVLLFTKPARPGQVKTRLIGELSAEQAAQLHAAFLGDLEARLRRGRFHLRIAWALPPDEAMPQMETAGVRQSGGDLGERLFRTLAGVARHYPRVAAIGSDHPDLPLSRVQRAFDKLSTGGDVVLGPAADGGYYLVAMRSECLQPGIFRDIEWSTPVVLETTLERCRELGLRVDLLATAADVDTPEDLRRLAATLRQRPGVECPRTRSLLRSWGRLQPTRRQGVSDEDP